MVTRFGEKYVLANVTEKETRYIFKFDNNYGASVVCSYYSRGGKRGLWELAVLYWYDGVAELDYNTPITNDTIGWLKEEEVESILKKIRELG